MKKQTTWQFLKAVHWINSSSINLLFLKSDIALKCIENLKQWYSHYFVFLILKNQFLKNPLLCYITEMVQATLRWHEMILFFKELFHEKLIQCYNFTKFWYLKKLSWNCPQRFALNEMFQWKFLYSLYFLCI